MLKGGFTFVIITDVYIISKDEIKCYISAKVGNMWICKILEKKMRLSGICVHFKGNVFRFIFDDYDLNFRLIFDKSLNNFFTL